MFCAGLAGALECRRVNVDSGHARGRGTSVKSVTMISWELDPFYVRGGTAYAIRRLADQLTELGIKTQVLFPGWPNTQPVLSLSPLLTPTPLKMRPGFFAAPRVVQCIEFCRVAIEETRLLAGIDAVIAHSDEGAMFIILRNRRRSPEPSVFWLHSLYDPPISDLSKEQLDLLPTQSLLASAVMLADIVVTSQGILKDAQELEWPDKLKELQTALTTASTEKRVLTVESVGCLSVMPNKLNHSSKPPSLTRLTSPYVFFPCRPHIDKGFGFFAAIAERLSAHNITCVAVLSPAHAAKLSGPSTNTQVHWLPWLPQEELKVAMRHAACTALPSLTEGFGLAAAESISLGVVTLYHEVGGHHGLPTLPNAVPIPVTRTERENLYRLWSELVANNPDSWSIWSKYEISLRPLVDKWVEAIRSVVHRPRQSMWEHSFRYPIEEQWGNRIRRRVELYAQVRKDAVLNRVAGMEK